MKRLFSFVCVAMLAAAASAQITWNTKGGIGVATCYGSEIDGLKSHIVGKIGAGIEKPLSSNISLMPSLEVAWKGTKVEDFATLDLIYLQVPVMVAYRLNLSDSWNTTFKVGPYFAYAVYDKFKVDGFGEVEGEEANKFDAGLDVGIDFEYHKFVFGVEGEMGFCKLYDSANIKNLAFYATVGWKF